MVTTLRLEARFSEKLCKALIASHLPVLYCVFFIECSQVWDEKKMKSILQMPQTFFLLTQPKMETLFNSNKITANDNILTVTMKQVTKIRKSF